MTRDYADKGTRIGLIGLGIMGTPIALRLRDQGYPLTVWNLEPDRYEQVRSSGAAWADNPAEVRENADVVFVCVLGDDALESVCFGEAGLASAPSGADVVVDLSTSSPEATLQLAPRLRDEAGADWIDAPMSGGPQPAREGAITLMIGGDADLCQRLDPLLRSISTNVTRMGELGAGQKAKVLNQQIVGVNYVLMAEVLATARAAGIDPDDLVRCLSGGMADSTILQRIFPQMAARDFDDPRSSVKQVNKDLTSVASFVRQLGLDLPLTERGVARYAEYASGNETRDGASVSLFYDTGDRP